MQRRIEKKRRERGEDGKNKQLELKGTNSGVKSKEIFIPTIVARKRAWDL